MGQYDGKEFEKILLEAQANMMKGIPSLDVEGNPGLPPTATGEQAIIHRALESPTGLYKSTHTWHQDTNKICYC